MKGKLNGLDLFSGIGGISIGLRKYVRTVAYCEINRYAQGVLLSRMQSGDIDRAPIWDDVRTLRKELLPRIDFISGGFPCQDLSVAGNGKGLEGERSGLFFEIIRLVSELRPRFVFLENVPAITVRGLERVTLEFTALGYDCRWTVVSAEAVGANHRRERWFLLAHPHGESVRVEQGGWIRPYREGPTEFGDYGQEGFMADANGGRRKQRDQEVGGLSEPYKVSSEVPNSKNENAIGRGYGNGEVCWDRPKATDLPGSEQTVANSDCFRRAETSGAEFEADRFTARDRGWWSAEPGVGRVVDGLPFRVDRIKCLGNGVVPLQIEEAFEYLGGFCENLYYLTNQKVFEDANQA